MQRIHTIQDGDTQWYDAKAAIVVDPGEVFIADLAFPATSAAVGAYAGYVLTGGFTADDYIVVSKPPD